jgi:hypothetical protein
MQVDIIEACSMMQPIAYEAVAKQTVNFMLGSVLVHIKG